MNRKRINAIIILGILSLTSILMVQLLWVRKTIEIQSTSIAIQQKSDSLNLKEFSEQTSLALRNVLEDISSNLEDSSDQYGAIKQISANQFTVDIIQELDPYYLETLLKKSLYSQNIHEDFTFGIYDCFNNKLLFSIEMLLDREGFIKPDKDSKLHIFSPSIGLKAYRRLF